MEGEEGGGGGEEGGRGGEGLRRREEGLAGLARSGLWGGGMQIVVSTQFNATHFVQLDCVQHG